MWGKILAAILASIIILVASSSFIETSFATPYIGPEPAPTNVTFYSHNISKPVYVGSTPALYILNTVNDTNATYLKRQACHRITLYISPVLYSTAISFKSYYKWYTGSLSLSKSDGEFFRRQHFLLFILTVSQWFHIFYRYISSI